MTQEERELLLRDLSARLTDGVKITWDGLYPITLTPSIYAALWKEKRDQNIPKVYLRPLSSMTEEEKKELCDIRPYFVNSDNIVSGTQCNTFIQASECQDWLNKKMFAYRTIDGKDMFELGIALQAPKGMY